MSPRREECRGHDGPFIPSKHDPEVCAVCDTLNRVGTLREIATYFPGDDEPLDEEPERGA